MLESDKIESFHKQGFIAGSVVLNDEEVAELRDELDRVLVDQGSPSVPQPAQISNLGGDEANPVWQIVNIWQASTAYRRHLSSPRIVEEVAQLTGATKLRVWHDQIQYKPPLHGGVNHWHQDAPLWPPVLPMNQVTAWVALDDVDESNGCMSMVPGSHQWGDQTDLLRSLKPGLELPPTFKGRHIEVRRRPVERGQVHYHHALTWHSSHANRADRPRRAITVHYLTPEARYVATAGDHVMRPYIHVGDGELLAGEAFPVVYDAKTARV